MTDLKTISDYVCTGRHAFVACVDESMIAELSAALRQNSLDAYEYCHLGAASNYEEIAELFCTACESLVDQIGLALERDDMAINRLLSATMSHFRARERMGVLFLDALDAVIPRQPPYRFEAALRSVMQRESDVAVVLCGSSTIVDAMAGPDRPFYKSFRRFRV